MAGEGLADWDFTPWPHQTGGVNAVAGMLARGVRRVLSTTPTGGGKSWMMRELARREVEAGGGVCLFTNRKLLTEQTVRALRAAGVPCGVRSADWDRVPDEPFQVCSIQTEHSRVVKRKTWEPHRNTTLIIIDEAHVMEGGAAAEVYKVYIDAGARKVGFTATPLGLDGCYDELVVAGTTSELRACGALVPAVHYGCTEPDLKNIKRVPLGEDLPEAENVKAVMVPGIHARVIDWFHRLNPHGLPSIGFAPGVPESLGFAEAFVRAGIPAAHIDGDFVWVNGRTIPSTQETRDALLEQSRTGEVRVVWNRFVLREAVDMPWLRHGIFATVFGSLQSCLQSGGRLLRACPVAGKDFVTVQDHGGNFWRHGSLNADRRWRLSDTDRILAGERQDAMAGDGENPPTQPEPFLCPGCGVVLVLKVMMRGGTVTCHRCGYQFDFKRRSRPVLQSDGELIEHVGDIFRPHRAERRPDTEQKWEQIYWRARRSKNGMTFTQAAGLFFTENGYFPPRSLPMMPKMAADYYRVVKTIPFHHLHPKE